jgi:hypothetical protein
MGFFNPASKALGEFISKLGDGARDQKANGLAIELARRLEQLNYILERVAEAEVTVRRADASLELAAGRTRTLKSHGTPRESAALTAAIQQSNDASRRHDEAVFELQFFVEAFYFFAGRVLQLLNDSNSPFPQLRRFHPKGVSDVRHRLLQHPEKINAQAFSTGFAWGGAEGPRVKVGRSERQPRELKDPGLATLE